MPRYSPCHPPRTTRAALQRPRLHRRRADVQVGPLDRSRLRRNVLHLLPVPRGRDARRATPVQHQRPIRIPTYTFVRILPPAARPALGYRRHEHHARRAQDPGHETDAHCTTRPSPWSSSRTSCLPTRRRATSPPLSPTSMSQASSSTSSVWCFITSMQPCTRHPIPRRGVCSGTARTARLRRARSLRQPARICHPARQPPGHASRGTVAN